MAVQFDNTRIILFGNGLFYDSYYFALASEVNALDYETIVKRVLGQWADTLASVTTNQDVVLLPYGFYDECIECFYAVVNDGQVVLRSVFVEVEGYSLDLLNLSEFMTGSYEILKPSPENFGVYEKAELIRALKEAEPAAV